MSEFNFKKFTIEDKPLFDKYFQEMQPEIAEYSFTNLFVWRDVGQFEFCQYEEGIIIKAHYRNERYFLPPIGYKNNKAIFQKLIYLAKEHNFPFKIRRVPENYIPTANELNLKVMEDRDNFDYIYLTEDLAYLKGRKYDGKRGFIKKFQKNYKYKYVKFKKEHIDCCLKLAEEWVKRKSSSDQSLIDEYNAIKETISYAEPLQMTGGFICVHDETVAFTFGEQLNNNTFVIHFEKANSQFNGSYQTINQLFVQNEILGKYKFINREQDVGVESIRKAKLSYQPVSMIKKYIISE